MTEHDCELVQGLEPPRFLVLGPNVIGDCKPAILVHAHICGGCRDQGGEITVATVNEAGEQTAAIVFDADQALVLAGILFDAVQRQAPGRKVQ